MGEILSNAELNRALLARQHLLERRRARIPETLEHLVGLQAQDPGDAYIALWSRLEGFDPDRLGRLLEDRKVVRMTLMRGTIHMVTSRDALGLRALVQPVLDRMLGAWRRQAKGVDPNDIAAAGRALLAGGPLTFAELGSRLARRWPEAEAEALARIVQMRVPLVQVPPRGVWGKRGAARHAPAESWLEDVPRSPLALDDLVLRYLGAFGPASVQDAQAWSGLTRLRGTFETLEDKLVAFRSPTGETLYDVPNAPRPPADTPAPPRFLPVYDNLVLGLRDRTRVVSPEVVVPLVSENTIVRWVLVGGILGATWSIRKTERTATLTVTPYAHVSGEDRVELREEGERLLEFVAPEATRGRVVFA